MHAQASTGTKRARYPMHCNITSAFAGARDALSIAYPATGSAEHLL